MSAANSNTSDLSQTDTFYHKLSPALIPIFKHLGISNVRDLHQIKDSYLRSYGYSDLDRLRILEAVNEILELKLPPHLIYAFDVDGTLTPHPGQSRNSLWYLDPIDYYNRLSILDRDRLIRILSIISDPLILISRNNEEKVRAFLGLLNTEFSKRINMTWSAFRSSGSYPTRESKISALINLTRLSTPVFYVDDSIHEIESCMNISPFLGCYHAQTWLRETSEFIQMALVAEKFLIERQNE